ncbi:MAG: hypothetical protein ACLGP3_08220 [Acidobacteriota bacterium]|jgi:hypothetical protein
MLSIGVYRISSFAQLPPGLPRLRLHLEVLGHEVHADRDTPDKPRFRHPWRTWPGVAVHYRLNGQPVVGSRGKTVWYVPLTQPRLARAIGLPTGTALKVVKVPVHCCPSQEARRLSGELAIQRILAGHGLAPGADGLLAVKNTAANTVRWFSHLLHFPAGSVHLATVVEHVTPEPLPADVNCDAPTFDLVGPPVDRLRAHCHCLGIEPYDLCLGNAFQVVGALRVVDFHNWTMTPAALAGRFSQLEDKPLMTRSTIWWTRPIRR